jgi:hypothetical protein
VNSSLEAADFKGFEGIWYTNIPIERHWISQKHACQSGNSRDEDGATTAHIVGLNWCVTDKREYLAALADVGTAVRKIIGNCNIAMACVHISALMEDRTKTRPE